MARRSTESDSELCQPLLKASEQSTRSAEEHGEGGLTWEKRVTKMRRIRAQVPIKPMFRCNDLLHSHSGLRGYSAHLSNSSADYCRSPTHCAKMTLEGHLSRPLSSPISHFRQQQCRVSSSGAFLLLFTNPHVNWVDLVWLPHSPPSLPLMS